MAKRHIVGQTNAAGYQLPVYAYSKPAELSAPVPRRVPVVVAGGGLSGLAAAADLASRGVPCVLLDDDCTVGVRGASSRGIAYARKTLETLKRLGALEPVLSRGVTWSVGRTFDMGEQLFKVDLAVDARCLQPSFVNLQQFYVEAALVDRAYELGVDMRWRNEVKAVHELTDGVAIDIDTPDGPYRLEADWLVDATGVNSTIRSDLGIPVASTQGEDKWCICDVRVKGGWPAERWTWVRAPFNGGRAVWQHPMADGVWRLDYQLAPDTPLGEINEAAARRLVTAQLGPGVEFEVVWTGPWSYRNQLAERFRHGRVLLVGDAAHAFSPFGGRGGNSGIQDAENAAWKLALVIRGLAPQSLLDTYDTERRAAAEHNLRVTSETARFLAPPTLPERTERDRILAAALTDPLMRAQVNTGKLSEAFVYASSGEGPSVGHALPNIALGLGDGSTTSLTELLAGPLSGLVLDFCDDTAASASLRAEIDGLRCDARWRRVSASAGPGDLVANDHLRALIGLPAGEEAVVVLRPDGHVSAVVPRLQAAAAVLRTIGVSPAHA